MSSGKYRITFGASLSPAVLVLLIINFSIFILQLIASFVPFSQNASYEDVLKLFLGLNHVGFYQNHYVWQIFTYMFLHGGWIHIIFNLLTLWMFSGDLERLWGTKRFVIYYLLSGIGAGLCIAAMNAFMASRFPGSSMIPTIGASGALYALLLAYGMTWPNREVLLYFLFPIKIKYLLLFFGLIEFFGTISSMRSSTDSISHIGHLGGLLAGFIILQIWKFSKTSKYGFFGYFLARRRFKKKRHEIDMRIKAKQTIDDLLDKIARQGISSLTDKEKRDLDWARRYYYPSDKETMH